MRRLLALVFVVAFLAADPPVRRGRSLVLRRSRRAASALAQAVLLGTIGLSVALEFRFVGEILVEYKVRITKLDEQQFAETVKHGVWGSGRPRFRKWEEGEYLVLLVGNGLAGVAQVSGAPFHSDAVVWSNGAFPYRVPIRFLRVLPAQYRPPVVGQIRGLLKRVWGTYWGLRIQNQDALVGEDARALLSIIDSTGSPPTQSEQTG